ncbi:MAG: hypothetical protein H0V29_08015 [Thermoleophilaceae bacterium]|nr:hypothetical protein [Thermoleophilaceae bacterium]
MDQVVLVTAAALFLTAALIVLCQGHRSGRIGLLGYAGKLAQRALGMPAWAALPSVIAVATLIPCLFGLQWDESIHMAQGRDEGPLANPSHYLLLFGIFGGFSAGVIAIALGDERVPASGIRAGPGWRAPLGGVLLAGGSGVALIGFPLDDVWHRLFGQDVTLWSATHVTMITGMALAVLGALMLNIEGLRTRNKVRRASIIRAPIQLLQKPTRAIQWLLLPGAILLILSLLMGEFDFGIPQFQLVLHPMIVMAAAGLGLVAARVSLGRGAAVGAALTFLVIRGVISVLVGPVLGQPDHIFPLFLAEAALVELVALRVSPREALRFGLWCGAFIGTVGLAAEWAWSGLYPIPWNSALLPEGLLLAMAMALAGSVLGAWLGAHMTVERFPRTPGLRRGAVASAAVISALIGWGLYEPAPDPVSATVTLDEVTPTPNRTVNATLRLDPPDAAKDADWLRTIAWQGGGLETEELREIGPGLYRTTRPVPVHGTWKSGIRLSRGGSLTSVAIFLPADSAIPVSEVPATPRFTRRFENEGKFLRREAKEVAPWLWNGATLFVAFVLMVLLYVWALAFRRLADAAPERAARAASRRQRGASHRDRDRVPV